MADDSAHPGRVYNSIHKAPLQWIVGSYRLGMLSCFFLLIAGAGGLAAFRSLPWYLALVPFLILLYLAWRVIRAIHLSDPDHALSEWSALRSTIHGARHRYDTNYGDKD